MSRNIDMERVGKAYVLRHTRFGKATVKVVAVRGEWADVEIVKGRLIGMRDEWGVGEMKTVRLDHCFFIKEVQS